MSKPRDQWIEDSWRAHAAEIKKGGLAVEDYSEDRSKCWACGSDQSRLQRCHVVPAMLGGKAKPSNIVPMCSRCHDIAPDVDSASHLFDWIRGQQNPLTGLGLGRYWGLVPTATRVCEHLTPDTLEEYMSVLKSTMIGKCGYHVGQNGQGSLVKIATIEWALEEALLAFLSSRKLQDVRQLQLLP